MPLSVSLRLSRPFVRRRHLELGPTLLPLLFSRLKERFLKNNLQLLAARFNIDASKAAIDQAELWSNPNISIEQNAYNKFTKKFFDVTKTGNTEVQLQQLILLAGKRDKQIRLAEINTQIAENTFYDLLRALKFELRTNFFDLYFLQQSLAFYDETIPNVRKTVAATEAIYQKRSILLSEVLRLKSLLFSLENERLGLLNQASEIEHGMSVLLRDTSGSFSSTLCRSSTEPCSTAFRSIPSPCRMLLQRPWKNVRIIKMRKPRCSTKMQICRCKKQ